MEHVICLVSSSIEKPLDIGLLDKVVEFLEFNSIKPIGKPVYLEANKAADIFISQALDVELLRDLRDMLDLYLTDVFCVPKEGRLKRLALFDMDSTIVAAETLDEMAERAGFGEQVAVITKKAMEEGLDFDWSLRTRLKKLEGVNADELCAPTYADMQLNEGAESLIKTLNEFGTKTILVSGGFTYFTEKVSQRLGMDGHHGNVLEVDENGLLTGCVVNDDDIVNGERKAKYLEHYAAQYGIDVKDAYAMGDGSNDIAMMSLAGMGVGYHPARGKKVEQEIVNIIRHGDLRCALYIMGISPE